MIRTLLAAAAIAALVPAYGAEEQPSEQTPAQAPAKKKHKAKKPVPAEEVKATDDKPAPSPAAEPSQEPAAEAKAKQEAPVEKIGSTSPATPSNTRAINVKEAVDIALARNPDLVKARQDLARTDAQFGVARGALFPQLNAELSGQHRKDAVLGTNFPQFGGDPYNSYQFLAEFNQLLFQWGAISGVKAANRGISAQEETLKLTERDLSAEVIESFYKLLLSNSNLEALEQVKDIDERALKTAQERFRIGRAQNLDVLQAKTQLALIRPQIEQARVNSRLAALDLARLLGAPTLDAIAVRGSLDVPRFQRLSERKGKEGRLEELPEFQRTIYQLEQADLQGDVTDGKNWPSISAFGNWGRSAFVKSDLLEPAATAWAVGVKVEIPIFSGLSSIYERRSQAALVAGLEADQLSTQQKLLTAQAGSRQNLDLAEQTMEASAQAFALAKSSLAEAEKDFRLALINYLQLLSVQQAYFQAETALYQARFGYIQSAVDYSKASGVPLSELVEFLSAASTPSLTAPAKGDHS